MQANLYLSSKRKQLQGALRLPRRVRDARHGREDLERVPGRAEHPIKHPSFEGWPRERHDQIKGELWRDVRLRPGDLLYLPRGQYRTTRSPTTGPACTSPGASPTRSAWTWSATPSSGWSAKRSGRLNLPRERGAPGAHRGDRADGGATSQRAPGARGHRPFVRQLPLAARSLRPAGPDRAGRAGLPRQARGPAARLPGRPARAGQGGARRAVEVRGRSSRRSNGSSTASGSPSASWPPPSRPVAGLDRLLADLSRMALVEPA